MRTVDTCLYGPLPVLGTLTQCRNTRKGWTGIREDGAVVEVTYRPEEREFGPARMPDTGYIVSTRPAVAGEHGNVHGNVSIGVVLLERAKRKPPRRSRGLKV
jgi:hypothetical protein